MEYQISTLRDIFEKIPTDKLDVFMKELTKTLQNAKTVNDSMCDIARALGQDVNVAFEWPEHITWIDDGKGNIKTTFGFDKHELVIEEKMG